MPYPEIANDRIRDENGNPLTPSEVRALLGTEITGEQRRLRHRRDARLTRRIAEIRASLGQEWATGIGAGVQESIDEIKAEDPTDPFWADPSVDNY